MVWTATTYSIVGGMAAIIAIGITVQVVRNRDQPGARAFAGLLLAIAGWSLVYGVQLGVSTYAEQLWLQRVALVLGGPIPSLWLLFIVQYAGREAWLTRPRLAALAVDPIVFCLLGLSNGSHGLVWDAATLVAAPTPVLELSLNVGYYLHLAYAYVTVGVGLWLLLGVFRQTSSVYRRQAGFLILGVIPALAVNVAYALRLPLGPLPAVDPTPFAFAFTGLFWGLALFRFDLLERTPIARERVLNEMGDGLIVLDAAGRVIDTSGPVDRVFNTTPAVGRHIGDLVAAGDETVESVRDAVDGRTITATVDGRERAYDVKWAVLTDDQDVVVGHALSLRDVTGRKEYEQRLEVAQRVLRHNLRNDMTVIRGWATELAENAAGEQAIAARSIDETAAELMDLSEKTRTMAQIDAIATENRTAVEITPHLQSLVEEYTSAHPDATIECDVPSGLTIALPDAAVLTVPVRNLLENAIEHNDTDAPWLRVTAERNGNGGVVVRVADNGPAIPEMERKTLAEGTEDPLQHGSGLGLWLVYWSIKTVGGRIDFDEREPRGNVVTIEFPAATTTAGASADRPRAPS